MSFSCARTCHDLLILPSYVFQSIVNVFHYTMTINVFSNHSPHVFSQFHVIPFSFLFINQYFFKCGRNCHGFIQRVNFLSRTTIPFLQWWGGPNLGTLAILFFVVGLVRSIMLCDIVPTIAMLFVGLGNKKVTRMVGCHGGFGHLCKSLLCIVISMSPRWTKLLQGRTME